MCNVKTEARLRIIIDAEKQYVLHICVCVGEEGEVPGRVGVCRRLSACSHGFQRATRMRHIAT